MMAVDRMLASNEALGVVLALALLAVGSRNRPFLRDVAADPERLWRVLARAAVVGVAALIAWISLFDNWRQLTGAPYRASERFASRRVEIDPPSDSVRAVTIALLAVMTVVVACLLARHVAGYLLQVVFLLGSLVLWIPIFAVRQRLNLDLAFGFDGSWRSPLDVTGYGLYVLLAWFAEIVLILVSFMVLLAATALPTTLLLDLLRRRHPRVTGEASDFFGSLGQRARAGGRTK